MIRLLFWLIVALFAAVGVSLLLKEDPGYVLVSMGDFTVETSVAAGVIVLALVFILLDIAVRLLTFITTLPKRTRKASRRRRWRNAMRDLALGMRQLHEQQWASAEVTLIRNAPFSDSPALHYIGAAQAAQHLGVEWRRDNYLHQLEDPIPKDETVAGLARAEFLLERNRASEAKQILRKLRHEQPRHVRVLRLSAECHAQLAEWEHVKEILPRLQQANAMRDSEHQDMLRRTYAGLLTQASRQGRVEDLEAIWHDVPNPLRLEDELLIEQAGHLRDNNAVEKAESLLVDALRHKWSEKLVVGYGQLGRGNANQQLTTAEAWLSKHPDDAYLLLTLGRLAKRANNLGKARSYLEDSCKRLPSPDTYYELAQVLEESGEYEAANRCYRAGLKLLASHPEERPEGELLPPPDSKEMALAKETTVEAAGR